MTIFNCRTLTSDSMDVIGRQYQVTNQNSDNKSKKTIVYIVLLIFLQNSDWNYLVKKDIA